MVTINFELDTEPCQFRWSGWSGRAELDVAGETVLLQDPRDPTTHYSSGLVRVWSHAVGLTTVRIEKRRPRAFAGFRDNHFTIQVDGVVVAQASGH